MLHFIETDIFTKQVNELLTDELYTQLQHELIKEPFKGDLIQGTGGVRKVRHNLANTGKSGGVRVIYYFVNNSGTFYMLLAYPKSKKINLTTKEKQALKALTNTLKNT